MTNLPPIRLAYVIKEMITGGSQTHLRQVCRLLDRSVFEPVFVCLTGKGELLDDVRTAGVPVFAPAADASFRGLGLLRRITETTKLFRDQRPMIVHNYLLRANLVGSMAARLAGVPVVIGSKRGCHERRGFELLSARLGNALADRVMVNAEAVREFVHGNEGLAREKMFVIPSGIDTDRFQPLPPQDFRARFGLPSDRPVVGAVTRMRARKGVEEYVRAIALVRDRIPDVLGVIVGEVSAEGWLADLIAELDLGDHLRLLGRRNDMPELLSALDLFVLSSHDEGMSNAILEAMAMERAVVATDVGGTGEVVKHEATGLLVPPRDPVPLAAAIAELLSQPARRAEMGRRGRVVIEEGFSARSMVRDMERTYLEIARQCRALPRS